MTMRLSPAPGSTPTMAGLVTAPARQGATPVRAVEHRSARLCTLANGQTLLLRPIRPGDATELLAFFGRLSAETLRLRFLSCRRVELAEAQAMAEVDHRQSEAVVACLGPESGAPIVALASYDATRSGAAEVAFTVEDGYQGRGLGRQLLAWIIAAAQAGGFTQLQGEALTENGRMLRLVCQSGYPSRLHRDMGSCDFTLAIGTSAALPLAA